MAVSIRVPRMVLLRVRSFSGRVHKSDICVETKKVFENGLLLRQRDTTNATLYDHPALFQDDVDIFHCTLHKFYPPQLSPLEAWDSLIKGLLLLSQPTFLKSMVLQVGCAPTNGYF